MTYTYTPLYKIRGVTTGHYGFVARGDLSGSLFTVIPFEDTYVGTYNSKVFRDYEAIDIDTNEWKRCWNCLKNNKYYEVVDDSWIQELVGPI